MKRFLKLWSLSRTVIANTKGLTLWEERGATEKSKRLHIFGLIGTTSARLDLQRGNLVFHGVLGGQAQSVSQHALFCTEVLSQEKLDWTWGHFKTRSRDIGERMKKK